MDKLVEIVAEHGGFWGLICLAAFVIIWKLWKHTLTQQTEMREMQKQMIKLQETRVIEAKEVRGEMQKFSEGMNQALGDMSTALGGVTQAVSGLKEAVMLRLKD